MYLNGTILKMEILLLLLFSFSVLFHECAANSNCSSQSPCSCLFLDGNEITLDGFNSANGGNSFVTVDGSDSNTYRFYPCGVDVPWDINGDCLTTDTACQYSRQENGYYSLGKTESFTIEEAVLAEMDSYLKFKYTGGTAERLSTITVSCSKEESLTFLDEYPNLEYNLEFKTPRGCPESGGGNAPAFFIFVILTLFVVAVTYIVVGTLLMVLWKGARGLEIIPNLGFWKDFPFLLKDGFLFCFSCIPDVRSRIGGHKEYSSLK